MGEPSRLKKRLHGRIVVPGSIRLVRTLIEHDARRVPPRRGRLATRAVSAAAAHLHDARLHQPFSGSQDVKAARVRNPEFATVVRESFSRQAMMTTLGARLTLVNPAGLRRVPEDRSLHAAERICPCRSDRKCRRFRVWLCGIHSGSSRYRRACRRVQDQPSRPSASACIRGESTSDSVWKDTFNVYRRGVCGPEWR